MLDINTATNTLSIQWIDHQTNLNFQISYGVSARTVLLFSSDDILVTNAMALIDGFMYGQNITNPTYFVEGVTINVTVVTRYPSGAGSGSPVMDTIMAQGSKCMAVLYILISLSPSLYYSLSSPSPLLVSSRPASLSHAEKESDEMRIQFWFRAARSR